MTEINTVDIKTDKLLFSEATSEVLPFLLDLYCTKEYLAGIKSKLNKSLSGFNFQKVLSFCQILEKILLRKHQKWKSPVDFIAANKELYFTVFGKLEFVECYTSDNLDPDF